MEGKKISFGFMKTKKADKPILDNNDDKKDYIECVEEHSIKIVGGEKLSSNQPLIIPMKPNTLIQPGRLREIALKVEDDLEQTAIKVEPVKDDKIPDPPMEPLLDAKRGIKLSISTTAIPTSTESDTSEEPEIKREPIDENNKSDLLENETLEQMAIRELMEDAKKQIKVVNPVLQAIPASGKGVADGENESTLDDYDAIPVQEFGLAMLRGMGWTPGQASSKYKQPELRPKGLGLGADKVIKAKPKASKDSKQEEELVILKNSYVKIVCGKYSDYYGKVMSLDEENGRVLVDIPLKKESVSLSEFMMIAVTKSEYDRESKVINSESYEEYKRKEVSEKHTREEDKKSYLRQDGKERGRKEEKENDRRDEQEKRYEKVEDRRDEKDRDRRDEKERDRRDENDRDRRNERDKDRKDERDRDRRDEKDRDRRDERERREDRDREKRSQKDVERRPDKVRESRDEKQVENRNERGRKYRQSENNDCRRDQESAYGKSKSRQRRDSSSSEDRSSRNKKNKKRYSSSDSLSSLSEDDRKQNKHSKSKSRRRSRSRSDSKSPAPEAKRDIDKKRKGKKKKRDRDRSPNYKKHRK